MNQLLPCPSRAADKAVAREGVLGPHARRRSNGADPAPSARRAKAGTRPDPTRDLIDDWIEGCCPTTAPSKDAAVITPSLSRSANSRRFVALVRDEALDVRIAFALALAKTPSSGSPVDERVA